MELLFGDGVGVGFRWRLGARGEDAAADVAFEEIGLLDGGSGLEEAGGGVRRWHGLAVGEDAIGETGELLGGVDAFGGGVGLTSDCDGEVAGDVVVAEAGLVAVLFGVPDEDADLVEVVGQAGLVGGEDGEVLGDAGDGCIVDDDAGVWVVDVSEDVGADDALAVGVAEEGVGGDDVGHAAVEPAGLALAIADEPPVFHGGCWGCSGGVWRGRGGGYAGRKGFGDGGAFEEAERIVFGEEVEVVGGAAGSDVEVDLVAGGGGGDDGVVFVGFTEGFERICDGGAGGLALFDPADGAVGGLYFKEAAGMVEDDELFAVGDGAGAVGDGGDAVAEDGFLGGDVDVLTGGLGVEVGAAREGECERGA